VQAYFLTRKGWAQLSLALRNRTRIERLHENNIMYQGMRRGWDCSTAGDWNYGKPSDNNNGIWLGIWGLGFKPRHLCQPLPPELPQNSQKNYSQPRFKMYVMINFVGRFSKKWFGRQCSTGCNPTTCILWTIKVN